MDEKILNQTKYLNKYIGLLKEIAAKDLETFLEDEILQGAAQRYLQTAIETCINIGNRIISLEQFRKPVKTPETYADVFEGLVTLGLLEAELGEKFKKMASFRNRLVHVYWDLDDTVIYEILTGRLADFEVFLKIAVGYLSQNNENRR